MVVYEQDPDVFRWSLHLLLPPAAALHYQRTSSVDNDEMIAHALQEELSNLASAEASAPSSQSQSLSSSCVLTQRWLHLPPSAPPLKEDEQDDAPPPAAPFTSSSTPGDNTISAHDCLIDFVDDFSALDGQVGKRLYDMIPIPITKDSFTGYVPMDYREYLKKMIKNGEWGDHVTLQAAADSYGVKIFILTSFRDTCYIEILPVVQKSERGSVGGGGRCAGGRTPARSGRPF
uniref:OTU domain-containing protein n=1 Tax=Oryza punctata TaxID=4537 RepID=A0A0E0KLV5_ORYPU